MAMSMGSSPHARGARANPSLFVKRVWDHPHMRGEHAKTEGAMDFEEGSSPHARGARGKGVHQAVARGIIPACAGSTWGPPRSRIPSWDHPRMRGEH